MKKLIASLLTFILITSSTAFASDKIYEFTDTSDILKGITRTHIRRLTSSGWQNINIVEADLSEEHLDITLLKSNKSIHKLDTVLNMANNEDTVAAINGDFFSWNNSIPGDGSSVGVEYKDGKMLSSYANSWEYASVIQTEEEKFLFDYIDAYMTITAPSGETAQVRHINKYDPYDKIVMYDRTWGEMSPGSATFQVEVVVEDDKLKSINYDMGPVEIPENGYVLTFLSDHTKFLVDNFAVGDPIKVDVSLKPNIENIKFAIGAGTMLVKDGKKTEITHNVSGNNPRTVFGTDKDGKKVYLITVDGRLAKSVGMTLSVLADFLIEYGVYNAVNLDGGGSTTLVSKSLGNDKNEVVNLPSGGSLRAVANGIGIKSDAKAGKLTSIRLSTEYENVFTNTSVYISAIGLDEYLHKVEIDSSDIEWSSDNSADVFKNGMFIPKGVGERTVTAKYGNVSATHKLNVLSSPTSIAVSSKEINLKSGESKYINVLGYDIEGYMAPINLNDLSISLSSDVVSFNGNNLVAKKKGSSLVTFEINGVTTNIIVNVDGHKSNISIPDDIAKADKANREANVISDNDSYSFAVFGDVIYNQTLGKNLIIPRISGEISKENEFVYYIGKGTDIPKNSKITAIPTLNHNVMMFKGDAFINLDNSKNSIFDTDKTQWPWFINTLDDTKIDNVFIFLSNGLYFDNEYEEELFYHIIDEKLVSKGKNVHIFYNNPSRVVMRNGVKFYATPGLSGYSGVKDMLENLAYLRVSVDGSDVTYQTKIID